MLASFPAYYSAEFLNQNALASWENLPLTTIYVGANGEPSAIFSVIYGYGAQATVTPLISSTGTGGYGAVSDNGVACDANYLYVLTWNHTIYRYDHRGNPAGIGQDPSTGVFVPVGAGGLGTASPSNYETQGMAIGPDGNLYVVDGNSVLSFSSASGAFLTSFVACPPSAGDPMTIAFDALGDMYVLGDMDGASWVLKFNGTSGQPKGTNGNTSDATLVAAGASGLSTFGGMCVAANLETGASTVYVTSVFGINMGGGQVRRHRRR